MLVEISGIDGSGKSTLIRAVKGALDARPGTWAYERNFRNRARRLLESVAMAAGHARAEGLFSPEALQLVDAVDLVDEASRTLLADAGDLNQVFLVDHYHTSWLARATADDPDAAARIAPVYARLPRPHLSFHLQVDPKLALSRLSARPGGDQLLQATAPLERLAALSATFAQATIALPYAVEILDAATPPEVLAARVTARILAHAP